MGFDVFGVAAKSEKGEYFRNNIWWWWPLAEYVLDNVEFVENDREMWHSNGGYEVSEASAVDIAITLQQLITEGHTARYQKAYKARLASLPLEKCEFCQGSGVRDDEFVKGTCNACQGRGERENFDLNYPFDEANVKEFAEFCRESGGFKIH
jgi:DnaJ-class molecular chaperone